MARPWRIQFEGAIYHITARGNNQQKIFLDDSDRRFFVDLMGRAAIRFNLDIFAFCLMSNHFHLFLRTAEANLSKAMQWLNGVYTSYFNWRHQRAGHLLQGRYKSVLVVDETHWLHLSMYVHLNPVRAHIVRNPIEYAWSSFRDYVSQKSRFGWLNREVILSNYGTRVSCHRDYRRECLALIYAKPDFVEQLKSSIIVGSRDSLEKLAKNYRPKGKIEDVTEYKEARRSAVDLKQEIKRIADLFNVRTEDLTNRGYGFPAKLAAYYHLAENCRVNTNEIAKIFNVTPSAVSHGISRFKKTKASGKLTRLSPK